jgi:hypothetical protein
MGCCWEVCRRSTFALQLPPVCPAGRTNAVTSARLYSTAHRRRLLIVWPLCRRWAGVYFAGMWPRGTRESNGRGPAATTAMWPAVLTGGRPGLEAAGQLPAGSTLVVLPQRSEGISLAKAAGHRQVADKQQAAGGCGSCRSHGQLPERGPVSCNGA